MLPRPTDLESSELMQRTELQKMVAGELYRPDSPEIAAAQQRAAAWMDRYNAAIDRSGAERHTMLAEILASVGEGATIRPPFFCDYGSFIRIGRGVFLNYNCVILDACSEIAIGDFTQIGPGVQILGADHPRDPVQRRALLEFGRPVRIGANVWIGAGALILPGVRIGDDAIIGAGSVVTRDVRAGSTVVGNPARPIER